MLLKLHMVPEGPWGQRVRIYAKRSCKAILYNSVLILLLLNCQLADSTSTQSSTSRENGHHYRTRRSMGARSRNRAQTPTGIMTDVQDRMELGAPSQRPPSPSEGGGGMLNLTQLWQARAGVGPTGAGPPGTGPVGPRVFLYPMPPVYKNDSWDGFMPNYGAERVIPEWLKGHGHVVEEPDQADLYLVDAWFYNSLFPILEAEGRRCQRRGGTELACAVLHALAYIRKHWPFFDRAQGVDHVWILTQDHGFCGFDGKGDMYLPEISKGIIASHWGYVKPEYECLLAKRLMKGYCPSRHPWLVPYQLPCHVPGKDVLPASTYIDEMYRDLQPELVEMKPVLPPEARGAGSKEDLQERLQCAKPNVIADGNRTVHLFPNRPRRLPLFFSGSVRMKDAQYSHGVRQSLATLYKGREDSFPGILVMGEGDPEYEEHMAEAVFCLAVTGGGWGVRLKMALLCGCIPLLLSDDVLAENADVIDASEFSVRLPERYLFRLDETVSHLQKRYADKVGEMQRKIACVWRYWVWTEPYGRAGEAFLCSLRRKLAGHHNLRPHMDWDTCTLRCELSQKHLHAF
eukprot:jgi/Botrbrau1/10905/Bobra.0025s0078.1